MRIDAGRHRGLKLSIAKGSATRPTSDRARQAIFNVLTHGEKREQMIDAHVLDAFAGTGALGLEALSRGAKTLVAFERDPVALAAIRANVARCREESRTRVLRADALHPPLAINHAGFAPCGLVFLDPPYGQGLAAPALAAIDRAGWIAPGAAIVVEIGASEGFAPPSQFSVLDDRRYGRARILFLSAAPRT